MAARLTDVERAERALAERDFSRLVTDLAEQLGWSWAHWRALQNRRGIWQVPVEGPLGAGWPDLTLLRARDRRLIFVELKKELELPSIRQSEVLLALMELTYPNCSCGAETGKPLEDWQLFGSQVVDGVRHDPGCRLTGGGRRTTDPRISTFVWRPSDLRDPIQDSVIYQVLR